MPLRPDSFQAKDTEEAKAIREGYVVDDDHEDLARLSDEDDGGAATLSARQLDAQYSAKYHIPKKLKRRYELIDSDTILSVRHLKQYFFFGSKINNQKLKAVSNVSFDVKKGECFGIVGESGCGKTTTGRTIIKLYDATSGSVYYRGYRISAGGRWNKKEIKWVRIKGKKKIAAIREDLAKKLAELPPLSEEASKKEADLLQNKANELATLKAELEKELAAIPAIPAETTEKLKAEHEANLAKIEKEIAAKFEESAKSLESAKTELSGRLSDLSIEEQTSLNELTGNDGQTKAKRAEIKQHFAAEKGAAKTEFKNKAETARYLTITTRADRAEKIDEENERYAKALEALDQSIPLKAQYAEKEKEIEKRYVDEIGEFDPAYKLRYETEEEVASINENIRLTVAEQRRKLREIRFDNNHCPKKLLNEIQMIFQDPVDSLDPRMTVEDIIQEGLRIQGHHNRAENHKKVVEMLEKVGLVAEHASRYPHEFSGGQRQRIGIARALVMNPQLLICDEPISALDVSIRAQIINLLNDLKDEMGLTIIFIAHDLSVVKYFCNRIAVMYFGKLVELTTSDELFRHPLHPYTVSLLSAIPKPNPLTEKERIRILYNPATAHDYSKDKPELREVCPGHVVYCNQAEFEQYQQRIKELDAAAAKEAK